MDGSKRNMFLYGGVQNFPTSPHELEVVKGSHFLLGSSIWSKCSFAMNVKSVRLTVLTRLSGETNNLPLIKVSIFKKINGSVARSLSEKMVMNVPPVDPSRLPEIINGKKTISSARSTLTTSVPSKNTEPRDSAKVDSQIHAGNPGTLTRCQTSDLVLEARGHRSQPFISGKVHDETRFGLSKLKPFSDITNLSTANSVLENGHGDQIYDLLKENAMVGGESGINVRRGARGKEPPSCQIGAPLIS